MSFQKLFGKDTLIQPLRGGSSDVASFKKRALVGQVFIDDEEPALYVAENTAGASDATLSKFGLPPAIPLTTARSVFFDGVNQYGSNSFDPSTVGAGDISIEIWFKPYHLETANAHAIFFLGDTTDGLGIEKVSASDQYRLRYYKASSGSTFHIGTDPAELAHQQIVLTRTGTTIKIFLDSVEIYSATNSNFDMVLNSGCFVGSRDSTPNAPWKGHIGLFRIWDAVLSQTTVESLYNAGVPVAADTESKGYANHTDLQVDNQFTELTGTTVADETTNGNSITLNNSPTWNEDHPSLGSPAYAATAAVEMDGVSDFALPFLDLGQAIGSGDFTVYIRCSFNDVTNNNYPFISGEIAGADNFVAFQSNTDIIRGLIRGSGGATQVINDTITAADATYYDLVITRKVNASDGTFEFFIDGVSMGTLTNTLLDDPIDRDAIIGSYFGGINHFGGKFRCLGIWDEVLTNAEITAITTLGDHDFRNNSGNYASEANLLNFLVALNKTGSITDLRGSGSAVFQVSPSYVSYP